jgi:polar amino acid transport system substrate-binding protein
MLSTKWFRLLSLVAAVAVLSVVFAACGDDDGEETTSTPAGTGTAATGTPAGSPVATAPELEDGVLQIGSDIAYAPIEFYEEGTQTPKGLDIDLADALAEELGVTAEFINSGFDGLRDALNANRFDIVMSSMTITPDREKEVDFIPYLSAGTDLLVPKGNPKNIQSVEDLSGLTVSVQLATIQVDQLEAANEQLKADGKPEIDVLTFDQNPLAVEQVRLGRADANIADSPVVANDALLSDGDLEAVGLAIEAAPYGIAVRKDSPELKAALEDALQAVIDSGKYDEILQTWSLSGGSIEQ